LELVVVNEVRIAHVNVEQLLSVKIWLLLNYLIVLHILNCNFLLLLNCLRSTQSVDEEPLLVASRGQLPHEIWFLHVV